MKTKLIISIVLFLCLTGMKHKKEADYQREFCTDGIMEYPLKDMSRVDCLTEKYAIELDFAKGGKHYNCLGQALHYSAMTDKIGKCVLIVRKESEMKKVKAIRNAIKYHKLNIELDIIKDYEEIK